MNQNYFCTKEYILTQVSQEAIFEFYFGDKISLDKRYKSPLRVDPSPGCSFFYGSSGDLLFFDSQYGNMDCFSFIMKKFNCGYYDAIIKIKLQFSLIKGRTIHILNEEKEPNLKKIQIKRRDYTKEELEYWSLPDLEITQETLEKHKIYSISDFWFNDVHKGYNLKHCYAYKQNKPYSYQLYRPFEDKNRRFRTNDGSYIYGKDELDPSLEEAIINKSPKDSFYARIAGYNSIGTIAEGFIIPPEYMEYLRTTFKRVYICYDNDEAGVKYTEKLVKQYPFLIPRYSLIGKDFSDMIKKQGVEWVRKNW